MKSMTGFGRGSHATDHFSINVELKTVNNRFLDVNLRLPSELQGLESTIKKLVGARMARGRVEVNLQYDRSDVVTMEVNRPLITGFLAAMKEIQQEFGMIGEPDINVIARLPGVVQTKKEEPSAEFLAAIELTFHDAIDDLDLMRSKEGELLAKELESRLAEIGSRIPTIESNAAVVSEEYRTRLTKRINEVLSKADAKVDLDEGRLTQEVAYLADRSDISEEIARLKTHIEHFRDIMRDDRDVGKRLDFLTQ
ncbi:MAG TPA: YicC/YloC family endoribonuclease, partial [Pyrinomonadaceae bacterium]